jgi:hypothetical protein
MNPQMSFEELDVVQLLPSLPTRHGPIPVHHGGATRQPEQHVRHGGLVAGDKAANGVLAGPEYHTVDYNHFEVLLADPVIDLAREFLFETTV